MFIEGPADWSALMIISTLDLDDSRERGAAALRFIGPSSAPPAGGRPA